MALALLEATGSNTAISIYIIVLAVIAIACTLALTETYQNAMDGTETEPARRVILPASASDADNRDV